MEFFLNLHTCKIYLFDLRFIKQKAYHIFYIEQLTFNVTFQSFLFGKFINSV